MAPTLAAPLPVFYDRDIDLGLIKAKRVAVVGYGSQGRAQALNLRDSGVGDMRIGLREGSKSAIAARADGFTVVPVAEAAAWCEVLALLTSDEAHRDLYRDHIGPHLKAGAALVFAHGLSIQFGLVTPAPGVDVVLCGPKGIGPRIRELYEGGEGVYGLLGVHQDATGGAKALALSSSRRWDAAAKEFWKLLSRTSASAISSPNRWCCAAACPSWCASRSPR